MNETDIIKELARYTDKRLYPFQVPNAFIYNWECDYWTMTQDGETREFEIKISISDYLKDAKKEKHNSIGGANYFYYVCPEGLIAKNIVDPKYGLIYVHKSGGFTIVKKPKRLHYNKFDNWKMLATKMYWRFYQIWRQKLFDKEITRDEYHEGFNLELSKFKP